MGGRSASQRNYCGNSHSLKTQTKGINKEIIERIQRKQMEISRKGGARTMCEVVVSSL